MFVVMSQDVTMAREIPNPESRIEIGRRLRLLRDAEGKTQAQMAKLAGLTTASAWNNYERGIRRIEMDSALELRRQLNIPLEYIYQGEMGRLPGDTLEKIHARMVIEAQEAKKKPPR